MFYTHVDNVTEPAVQYHDHICEHVDWQREHQRLESLRSTGDISSIDEGKLCELEQADDIER